MVKRSAGLLFRVVKGFVEVFLVHQGGPFFGKKDVVFGLFRRENWTGMRARRRGGGLFDPFRVGA